MGRAHRKLPMTMLGFNYDSWGSEAPPYSKPKGAKQSYTQKERQAACLVPHFP